MELLSLRFGAFCLAALLAFHAWRDARWRQLVLGAASAVYVASFVGKVVELSALAGFLALGYGLVLLARAKPPPVVFGLGVVVVVVSFAWLKRYSALAGLPALPDAWVTVGLSYVLFRVLQLSIDAYQEEGRAPVGPLAYLLFCCSFLTFASGPIQRYDEHRSQLGKLGDFTLDAATAYAGASRVANGLLKVALLSGLLQQLHASFVAREGPLAFAAAAVSWLAFLYANFSGSIDVVLGLGRLFGLALPENFDRPFRAGNLLELWNRWHITLSQWFKFYLFNPLLKLFGRFGGTPTAMLWAGVAGYFMTFFLMGVWHGTSWAFVAYGALLGAGVAGTKLYESLATRRLGKKGLASLRGRLPYAAAARGFTFAYFAVALALWWLPPAKFFTAGTLLGFLAAWVSLAVVSLPFVLSERGAPKGQPAGPIRLSHQLWLGARAFAIAALGFDSAYRVPELIYRGF